MQFIKLVLFQLKLYVKNSYFVNLVLIETTTMLLYEYLAHYIAQDYSGKEWLIAGIMGTWASCTTSAGALGYQRYQGTLIYLLNSTISSAKVLLATLAPAAIYGLIAFPVAEIEASLLKMPVKYLNGRLLIGILLLWLSSTILSYLISLFFLLIKNAMQYEDLILLPILLLSGMLTIPNFIKKTIQPLQLLSPLTLPIRIIYQQSIQEQSIIIYIIVLIVLTLVAKIMTNYVIQRAFKDGRLDIF